MIKLSEENKCWIEMRREETVWYFMSKTVNGVGVMVSREFRNRAICRNTALKQAKYFKTEFREYEGDKLCRKISAKSVQAIN